MDCMLTEPICGIAGASYARPEAASDHVLDQDHDRMSPEEDWVGMTFEDALPCSGCSGDTVEPTTPGCLHVGDTFCVSLSAEREPPTHPPQTGGSPCSPCTSPNHMNPMDKLCAQLRKSLSPILKAPPTRTNATAQIRTRQKRAPVSNSRRSVRLARGVGCGSNTSKQKGVLIQKLCLANEAETISDEALQLYAELFDQPLSDGHIKAILTLFGWDPSILPLWDHEDAVEDRR